MGVQFAGNILVQANGGPLPISQGGTGQTTAPTAINALLPVQTGNSGKILSTDGTNISWSTAAAGGTPGGVDTQIQFNDSGTFGGSSNFVINKTTGALTAASTLSSSGLMVNGAPATNRTVQFQTSGSSRWLLQTNAAAESGAAAGSNFEIVAVADNGSTQNQVLTISRATRAVDFKVAPTLNGVAIGGGSITIGSTSIALGSSSTTLDGLTSVTSTTFTGSGAGLTSIPNSALTNSSLTIGTTAISLGTSSTTLAGLTSVTSTAFVGALTGSATQLGGVVAANYAQLASVQTFTSPQRTSEVTDNDGSFDLGAAQDFRCTPTGAFTLTFTNIPASPIVQQGTIILINSGGHAVSAHANTKLGASTLATISAAGTYQLAYRTSNGLAYITSSGALA